MRGGSRRPNGRSHSHGGGFIAGDHVKNVAGRAGGGRWLEERGERRGWGEAPALTRGARGKPATERTFAQPRRGIHRRRSRQKRGWAGGRREVAGGARRAARLGRSSCLDARCAGEAGDRTDVRTATAGGKNTKHPKHGVNAWGSVHYGGFRCTANGGNTVPPWTGIRLSSERKAIALRAEQTERR